MSELDRYLERPLSSPAPGVLEAIAAGPIAAEQALPLADLDRLLDPAPLDAETGWCRLDDGVAYVAVRTPMPKVTGAMVDWWFDWHPEEAIRYRIWHPRAHTSNRVERPAHAGAKRHWNTIHHPVEDVGTGTEHVRIEFRPPTKMGFSTDALDDPRVATIACGHAGDDRRRVRHSAMVHVWLNDGDEGTVLRSRFWLGAALPRLLARRAVRNAMMPRDLPHALATHCAEEYANLAELLPELHARYTH